MSKLLEHIIKNVLFEQTIDYKKSIDTIDKLSDGVRYIDNINIGGTLPIKYGLHLKSKSFNKSKINSYLKTNVYNNDQYMNRFKQKHVLIPQQQKNNLFIWVYSDSNNPNILWNKYRHIYNIYSKTLKKYGKLRDTARRINKKLGNKEHSTFTIISVDSKLILNKYLDNETFVFWPEEDIKILNDVITELNTRYLDIKEKIKFWQSLLKKLRSQLAKAQIPEDTTKYLRPRNIDDQDDEKYIIGFKINILLFLEKYNSQFSSMEQSPINDYDINKLKYYLDSSEFLKNSMQLKSKQDVLFNSSPKWDNFLQNTVKILNIILTDSQERSSKWMKTPIYRIIHNESDIKKQFN